MDSRTRALIRERAISVWLRADLDLLMRRVSRRNDRPLLQVAEPRQKLAELMAQRHPVYAEADLTVDSVDGPPEATLELVVASLDAFLRTAPARQRAAS
jgi:shikimate kinase